MWFFIFLNTNWQYNFKIQHSLNTYFTLNNSWNEWKAKNKYFKTIHQTIQIWTRKYYTLNVAQQSPRLSRVDNDMIDEDINDTLLQINMSVPPENTESHRRVAITCLYVSIFTSVIHIMSHMVQITNIY